MGYDPEESFSNMPRHQQNPLGSWTIGQLVRQMGPLAGLRKRFREDPYLDDVTLCQLIRCKTALENFLAQCRCRPHCGDTSVARLRAVIELAESDPNSWVFEASR